MLILIRKLREVVVIVRTEDVKQKQKSKVEIIRDINKKLKEEVVIVVRRLLNSNILVIFNKAEFKDKQETT